MNSNSWIRIVAFLSCLNLTNIITEFLKRPFRKKWWKEVQGWATQHENTLCYVPGLYRRPNVNDFRAKVLYSLFSLALTHRVCVVHWNSKFIIILWREGRKEPTKFFFLSVFGSPGSHMHFFDCINSYSSLFGWKKYQHCPTLNIPNCLSSNQFVGTNMCGE